MNSLAIIIALAALAVSVYGVSKSPRARRSTDIEQEKEAIIAEVEADYRARVDAFHAELNADLVAADSKHLQDLVDMKAYVDKANDGQLAIESGSGH